MTGSAEYVCRTCGKPVTAQDAFCANCGRTLGEPKDPKQAYCRQCGKPVANRDDTCAWCGRRLGRPPIRTSHLIVGAIAVLMLIGFITSRLFPHRTQVVTLCGSVRVVVAKDEDALDRSRSGDSETLLRLTAAGRIDSTPAGVRARVIFVHDLADGDQNLLVRIIDGPLQGESVWIANNRIVKVEEVSE